MVNVRTVIAAHEDMATWLVGSRGPLGGTGGESGAFEDDVVASFERLEAQAKGTDTALREGNWFRQVSVAQTQAMARFASDSRLGLSALGNAAGSIGDAYDRVDRESYQTFDEPLGHIASIDG